MNERPGCNISAPLKPQKSFFPAIETRQVTGVCKARKFASLKDGKLVIDCPETAYFSTQIPKNYPRGASPYPLVDPKEYVTISTYFDSR